MYQIHYFSCLFYSQCLYICSSLNHDTAVSGRGTPGLEFIFISTRLGVTCPKWSLITTWAIFLLPARQEQNSILWQFNLKKKPNSKYFAKSATNQIGIYTLYIEWLYTSIYIDRDRNESNKYISPVHILRHAHS